MPTPKKLRESPDASDFMSLIKKMLKQEPPLDGRHGKVRKKAPRKIDAKKGTS